MKQPFVIENRVGAGGNIGTAFVAQAPADGYTVMLTLSLTHTTVPMLQSKVPYDPLRDFSTAVADCHRRADAGGARRRDAQADVRAANLRYVGGVAHFDVELQAEGTTIAGCTLPMPGDHNVSNALSAIAVARHLGMKRDEIREGCRQDSEMRLIRFHRRLQYVNIPFNDNFLHPVGQEFLHFQISRLPQTSL
ncbi:MAG: hypothetical protein HC933_16765 [Pleurocapsa sp. SU_196_0]|nr:hypothetical protein [Pleurocapsa sp. SU_196_0]